MSSEPEVEQPYTNPMKRTYLAVGIFAATLVGVAVLTTRLFHPLYISNATSVQVEVRVGNKKITLAPAGIAILRPGRGEHDVLIRARNGQERSTTIAMDSDKTFVLSVFAADIFVVEEVVYSLASRGPGKVSYFGGKEFYGFERIDHPFEPPPKSIRTQNFDDIKLVLDRVDGPAAYVLAGIQQHPSSLPEVDVLAFAEGRIRGGDKNSELLLIYKVLCDKLEQQKRCEDFLNEHGLLPR